MRAHKATTARRRGFTLVELLVTVSIMVLVASIAVAAIAPMLRGQTMTTGAHAVQAIIYQARSQAVSLRTEATIRFHVTEGRMELYATHADAATLDPVARADPRVEAPDFLPQGVQFMDLDTDGEFYYLEFTRSGALRTSGIRLIRLSDPNGRNVKIVEVLFATGMTRVYDE